MTLASLLHDTPLWSPIGLPPENSKIIILCSYDDIQHIHSVFTKHKIVLIISNKHQEQNLDFNQILNHKYCLLVIFSTKSNFELLHYFYTKLAEIKIRHSYICMPLQTNLFTFSFYYQEFFEQYEKELEYVYTLLEDDDSRRIFASRIRSILTGNI